MRADAIGLFWQDMPTSRKRSERTLGPIPEIPETGWRPIAELPNIRDCGWISLDCETYDPELNDYGPGWARGKGHICGVSLAWEGGKAYLPMRHTVQSEYNFDPELILRYLRWALGGTCPKVGANLYYDIGWLRWEGVHVEGQLYDVQYAQALIDSESKLSLEDLGLKHLRRGKKTDIVKEWAMSYYMSTTSLWRKDIYRCPVTLVGPYAEEDAVMPKEILDIQWPILHQLKLLDLFKMECGLIRLLIDMRYAGIQIDVPYVDELRSKFVAKEAEVQKQINYVAGFEVNVNAADSLSTAFDKLGIPYERTEPTASFPEGRPSFKKDFLKSVQHPLAKNIIELRGVSKLRSTFVESYLLNSHVNGKVYCSFHPLMSTDGGTRTGRFSSSSPNLQNIPIRTEEGKWLRRAFIKDFDHQQLRDYDYCLTGETKIQTDIGDIRIDSIIPGEHQVMSVNTLTDEIEYKPVTRAARIGELHTCRVTFMDGSYIDATLDHHWLLKNKKNEIGVNKKATIDLMPGDRLAHVYTHFINKRARISFKNFSEMRSRLICTGRYGPAPKDHDADHIDNDRTNDNYKNLRWLHEALNRAQGGQHYWQDVKIGKRSDELRLEKLRESMKYRDLSGINNGRYGTSMPGIGGRPFLGEIRNCLNCGLSFKSKRCQPSECCTINCTRTYKAKQKWGNKFSSRERNCVVCSKDFIAPSYDPKHKTCSYKCSGIYKMKNHKVASVEYIGIQPVYQITVADNHNYVTSNGSIHFQSQIEYRMLAHYATGGGSDEIRRQYSTDPNTDFHDLAGRMVKQITGIELKRSYVKTINFGIIYGIGVPHLSEMLGVTEKAAGQLRTQYHKALPFTKETMQATIDEIAHSGICTTILGRRTIFNLYEPAKWGGYVQPLPYDQALEKWGSNLRRGGTQKALNYRLQGSAADMMKKSMYENYKAGVFNYTGVPRLTVHDELLFSDPGNVPLDAWEYMQHTAETCIPLRIPVKFEGSTGADWASAHD